MIMKDKYIYLTFLFFLIYSASVYPTLPWDMQKGERIVLPNCSVNKKDTINDVFIVYLKDSIQLYKVISTQEKFMSALEEDSTYDVVLEVIKGSAFDYVSLGDYTMSFVESVDRCSIGKYFTTVSLIDTVDSTHFVRHKYLYRFVRIGKFNDCENCESKIRHKGIKMQNTSRETISEIGVRYLTDLLLKDNALFSEFEVQIAYDYAMPIEYKTVSNRLRDFYEKIYQITLPEGDSDSVRYYNEYCKIPFYKSNKRISPFSKDWSVVQNRCELSVGMLVYYMGNLNMCFTITNFKKNEYMVGVVIMDSEGGLIDYYISEEDPMISIVMGADRLYNMGLVIKDGGRKKVVIEDGYVLKPRKYRNGKERE